MEYKISYMPAKEELIGPIYKITCNDAEAKAFLKAINKAIKRIEAARKKEFKEGLKEGARTSPYKTMQSEDDTFIFDSLHVDDVCLAARHITGQRIRVSFLQPRFEITAKLVDDFEKAIAEQSEN